MRLLLALPLMLAPLAAAWADSPSAGARISLSVHEQADLPNDEVVVVYRVAARGRRPARLRAEVNRVGDVIHARLSREPGLKQMALSRRMDIVWRYDDALRRQVRDEDVRSVLKRWIRPDRATTGVLLPVHAHGGRS